MTTTIMVFGIGTVAFLLGAVWGRWTMLDTIRMLELEAQVVRRFAGKLGDRIGRQRVMIGRLKAQLKTVATSTPVTMEKPTNRPNLPH